MVLKQNSDKKMAQSVILNMSMVLNHLWNNKGGDYSKQCKIASPHGEGDDCVMVLLPIIFFLTRP